MPDAGPLQSAARSVPSAAKVAGVGNGLGLAGGAVGGVTGIQEIIQGVREKDGKQVLTGATDVTVAGVTLASLGLIGGGVILGPLAATMLTGRAMHRLDQSDRPTRLDGWGDLGTAGAVFCRMLHGPLAATAGLGLLGAGMDVFKGLHHIRQGHETHDPALRIKGTGEMLAAAGVLALTTGLAVVPGIGLIVAGVALPLLQRVKTLRPVIDRLVGVTDRVMYPVAVHADQTAHAAMGRLEPVTRPIQHAIQEARDAAAPVLDPLDSARHRATEALMNGAHRGLNYLSNSGPVQNARAWVERVHERLLPPTQDAPPDAGASDKTTLP